MTSHEAVAHRAFELFFSFIQNNFQMTEIVLRCEERNSILSVPCVAACRMWMLLHQLMSLCIKILFLKKIIIFLLVDCCKMLGIEYFMLEFLLRDCTSHEDLL